MVTVGRKPVLDELVVDVEVEGAEYVGKEEQDLVAGSETYVATPAMASVRPRVFGQVTLSAYPSPTRPAVPSTCPRIATTDLMTRKRV